MPHGPVSDGVTLGRHPAAHIGRRWVLGVVIGTIGFEIWSDLIHYIQIGTAGLLPVLVRLALTCILMDYLYFGYAWARWLTVMLLLISGPVLLVQLLKEGIQNEMGLALALIFCGYIVVGSALAFSKSVGDYFAMRRELREGLDVMPEIPGPLGSQQRPDDASPASRDRS